MMERLIENMQAYITMPFSLSICKCIKLFYENQYQMFFIYNYKNKQKNISHNFIYIWNGG